MTLRRGRARIRVSLLLLLLRLGKGGQEPPTNANGHQRCAGANSHTQRRPRRPSVVAAAVGRVPVVAIVWGPICVAPIGRGPYGDRHAVTARVARTLHLHCLLLLLPLLLLLLLRSVSLLGIIWLLLLLVWSRKVRQ